MLPVDSSLSSPVDPVTSSMRRLSLAPIAPSTDPSPRVSPLTLPTTDPQAKVAKAYDAAVSSAQTTATETHGTIVSVAQDAQWPIAAFSALDTNVPIGPNLPVKRFSKMNTITPQTPANSRHNSIIDLAHSPTNSGSSARQPHYVISTISADGKRTTKVMPIDFSDMKSPMAKASVRNAERAIVAAAAMTKCECEDAQEFTREQSREIYRLNHKKVAMYVNPPEQDGKKKKKPKARRLTNLK